MSRSLATLAALAITALPALAHPGHLLDEGHSHVHWDELLIVAGIGAALVGYGAAHALYRRHRRRRA